MSGIILTSSALILILISVRRLLRGKLNPTFQYSLWLLVALRLLIPGAFFPAPVSLLGLLDTVQTVTVSADLPEHTPQNIVVSDILSGEEAGRFPATPSGGLHTPKENSAPAPILPAAFLVSNIRFLWKIGMVITGCWLLFINLSFALRLRKKRVYLRQARQTPVYLVKDLPSPCLFGLLRPSIYINESALQHPHLEHILLHEKIHLRHGDHIWAALRCLCLTIHWYNPLVWAAAVLSRRDCETACDDGVIHRLDEEQRLRYGSMLLSMAKGSRATVLHAATTMTSQKRTMLERISLIARQPHMLRITLAAVLLVMSAAVMLTFGGAADPTTAEIDSPSDPIAAERSAAEKSEPNAPAQNPVKSESSLPHSPPADTVSYRHISGMFSLQLPDGWQKTVTAVESADGVDFYLSERYDPAAEQDRRNDSGWLMSIVPQPVYWAEQHDLNVLPDSTFNCNGTAYAYVLTVNGESGEFASEIAASLSAAVETFRLQTEPALITKLVHDNYKTDPALAIRYLPYLSWTGYTAAYGEDGLPDLLVGLWQLAENAALSWAQYHDLLSAPSDSSIDGAYATMYQELIWSLYQKNPQQFASVLASGYLSGSEQANALNWLRVPMSEQTGSSALVSNTELWHILGLPLLTHTDTTLQSPGESFRLLPIINEAGTSLIYTSDNPSVASVTADGTVTAVSSGTTRIRVTFTDGRKTQEASCIVRCSRESEANTAALAFLENYSSFVLVEFLRGQETWNMASLQTTLERGYAAALVGSPLEGHLAAVTVESGFVFPASPKSGQTIRIPVTLTYRITDAGKSITVPVTGQICELGFYEEGGIMPEWMRSAQHHQSLIEAAVSAGT